MRAPLALALAVALLAAPALGQAGAPDPSFGTGGRLTLPLGFEPRSEAAAAARQPDGRVVVVGWARPYQSAFALARFMPDGALDPSFGDGGVVVTDPGTAVAQFYAVAVQADGRIVAAGQVQADVGTYHSSFAVARYLPDGTLDPAFGAGGIVVTDVVPGFGGVDIGRSVALQPDGRIVVGGEAGSEGDFALVRYLPTGALDSSFGAAGVVVHVRPGSSEAASALALRPDGRIVAAGGGDVISGGGAVARFMPDGALDVTFGGGVVDVLTGGKDVAVSGLVLQPDGRVVVVGSSHGDAVAVRFEEGGARDATFGDGGEVWVDFGWYDFGMALALQPDGALVLAGRASIPGSPATYSHYDFALARLLPDGALDPAFGEGGRVRTPIVPNRNDGARAVLVDPDGLIVAVGSGDDWDRIALARYSAGGALDPAFGGDGVVVAEARTPHDSRAYAVAVQPDGRVVIGGMAEGAGRYLLARLLPDGALDGSFGEGGVVRVGLHSSPVSLDLLPDGRIVAGGGGDGGLSATRFLPDGVLDPSYGTGGVARAALPYEQGVGLGATDVALLPDGSTVVAGVRNYRDIGVDDDAVAVCRFTPSGALDPTFGGGIVVTDLGVGDERARAVAVDAAGRVYVAGSVRTGGVTTLAVLRYGADGGLDPAFGEGGVARAPVGVWSEATDVRLLDDGRVLVAGGGGTSAGAGAFALARFLPDGALDPSFGAAGTVTTPLGAGGAVALDVRPDGRIVASGSGPGAFVLAGYTADGALDPAFGSGGVATVAFGTASVSAADAELMADGRVVVAGSTWVDGVYDVAVARVLGPAATPSEEGPADHAVTLAAPAPNPVRERATLRYTLPHAAPVRIVLYDGLGREVAVLLDSPRPAGAHVLALDATAWAPGVYVVRVTAGTGAATARLVVAR